jgi:hypothetical protein
MQASLGWGWPAGTGDTVQQQEEMMADPDVTRRDVLTKTAYMTPAVITLPVLLSFASAGSGDKDKDKDKGKDKGK